MAKLRHIAMQVPNLQESAAYYEKLFELDRVCDVESEYGNAVMLSDGTMNLTLLHFPEGTKGGKNGPDWAGLHHMGFVVDDIDEHTKIIEENGGNYHMRLPSAPDSPSEVKFRDPNGVVFDIVTNKYASGSWGSKA